MTRTNLIGTVLGRYRIDAELGHGGMGVVFRATDLELRRSVALKLLGDGVVEDPDRRRRFLREARVAAAIAHPNIATVYDVGETENGQVFIAMELIEGHSLRHRVERGAMPARAALGIAKDLARALSKAHKLGIIHRDLKPDNVMVSETFDVKVLDFGLAKPLEPARNREGSSLAESRVITEAGQLVGTPGYMSPEQAAGRPLDERTDIFSIGVVLYEMVTGGRPFRGATAIDIIIATARDEPAAPTSIVAHLDPRLERVILRCLEKNADARYADAPELLRALDDLGPLEDAPVTAGRTGPIAGSQAEDAGALPTQASLVGTASPESPPEAALRARPRRRIVLAALGVAALATAVVGVRLARPQAWTGAVPSATTLLDLPPPRPALPAVRAEFAAGLQALHDDDWGTAQARFQRVVELDPLLALGHLRLAMAAEGTLDESIRREHYAKAVTLRSQLDERDAGMMVALEPILQRLREDRAEAVKRLRSLSDRYPGDVELHVWLAMLQGTTGTGLRDAEQAIALDPHDAQAWQTRGDILGTLGRTEESRASYERCGASSTASAECFLGLIWLDSADGRCADAERDARRAVDRDPHLAGNLACVMYGAGRPVEAVRQVVNQLAATFASSPSWQNIDAIRLALVEGDFAHARPLAERYQAIVERNANAPFIDHLRVAEVLIGIARETGDDAEAFRLALDFASRSDTWSKSRQGDGIDGSRSVERQAISKGGRGATEFVSRRAAWIAEQKQNLAHPGLTWTYAFASAAQTPEEAVEALRVLPEFLPLSSVVHYVGIPDAEVGSTYLLAGDVDRAIPYLTKAVASCAAFRHPFVHARATLQLGQALEQKADTAGACGAYQKVVVRWGNAKPRSISAEKAAARMTALACPK